MYRNRAICIAIAAALMCAWTSAVMADGDDPKLDLTIGDKAPALDIEYWIKGDKIKDFEKDHIYVVEFWATWCGPCVASMPHLSELQEKYADKKVKVISISDESVDTVKSFLKKKYEPENKIHDQRTRYTLTTDPDKSSDKAYMKAARQPGIPTAFLVGKTGLIEWIGHPMELDDVLAKVVADKWDAKAFKKTFEKTMQLDAFFQKGDFKGALKLLEDLAKSDPENPQWGMMQAQILCMTKDYDAAYKVFAKVVKAKWDDAQMLNEIAWFLVADEGLEKRDLKLALKAAERACELTKHAEAPILDTLARAHYELGNLAEAIKWQTKAVESLGEDAGPMGDELKETLKQYREEAAKKGE